MGRNLWTGKGAVTSFNVYQFWPGKSYPFLPYMQPIYPVLAGFLWVFSGYGAVVGFNIFLAAVNVLVLYFLLKQRLGAVWAFCAVLLVACSKNYIFPAIYPWTEHLHLLFLLGALWVYLNVDRSLFLVGLILGASLLVRVAGMYDIFCFLVSLVFFKGLSRSFWKDCLQLGAGVLAVIGPYEIACYALYGKIYPQYLSAAMIYRMSEIKTGAFYQNGFPVLNIFGTQTPLHAALMNMKSHFVQLFLVFGSLAPFGLFALFWGGYDVVKRRERLTTLLYCQAAGLLIFYPVSLYWLGHIESLRYSLIPYLALISLGMIYLKELASGFRLKRFAAGRILALAVVFLSMIGTVNTGT